nr:hypothetical protein [Candidatus Levybacteria bacterium]
MSNKLTQKIRKETIKNPYETGRDVVSQLKDAARQELSEDWRIAMRQMLGVKEDNNDVKASGDLNEGEEVNFPKKEKKRDIELGIDYFREIIHTETTISRKDEAHLEAKIQEIVIELKKLSESSKELELEFKDITVATLPVKPGKYHLNFFEWMLVTIQNARMRIEDSTVWMGVISGKKSKKDYWTLVKNQGTSFMLSGERTSATQVG